MTREEAIQILRDWDGYFIGHSSDDVNEALNIAVNALEQEPKTGHWITTRTFMHDGEFYCDRCKCESPNNEKWDYCPNCGAMMIESQENKPKTEFWWNIIGGQREDL